MTCVRGVTLMDGHGKKDNNNGFGLGIRSTIVLWTTKHPDPIVVAIIRYESEVFIDQSVGSPGMSEQRCPDCKQRTDDSSGYTVSPTAA